MRLFSKKKQTIGEMLKELREKKGLTQKELAKELSITRQAISELERGKAKPSVDVLIKLRSKYKVNLNKVLGSDK